MSAPRVFFALFLLGATLLAPLAIAAVLSLLLDAT